MERRYLTTTLPYVNAAPHIGFALEIIQADIIARYWRLLGYEVFFNTGTDEHGLKIFRKAEEAGLSAKEYTDQLFVKFKELNEQLHIDTANPNFNFIRTTDDYHERAAQEFWKVCLENGDIYKKQYEVKYCVGCELEKTDSELENGKCPIHPNLEIEVINEENYFFRFSKYQDALLQLYRDNPKFTVPTSRQKEIQSFVERGLEDFSISRLKEKMPWGVPVPDDPDQVMYVWFDALVNYISAIGWPDDTTKFNKWWPVYQFAGKDNLRQQSAMWQAMLMSAGIESSKQVFIHGFITAGGQKMSKSLGNVVDPLKVIEEYGIEALRYFLTREITPFEDGDYTDERFKSAYNANLANGLGNLVSRVLKMANLYEVKIKPEDMAEAGELIKDEFYREYREALDNYEFNKAADFIWTQIGEADLYIQNTAPFKLIKTDPEAAKNHISYLLGALWRITVPLIPIMPTTAEKIQAMIKSGETPEPLFVRKD